MLFRSDVWWEGCDQKTDGLTNWKGVINDELNLELVSHPNARFTVRASQCPQWAFDCDKKWVPISAIIFGGKRMVCDIPLIREASNFKQGVLMGATLSSEMTAASDGIVGTIRYDPFAMLPFFGYNIGDYINHWLEMENKLNIIPHIYYINLFGKKEKKFIWPGFSDNIHLLIWIYNRIIHNIDYSVTVIGNVPLFVNDTHNNFSQNFQSMCDNIVINREFWNIQLNLDREHLIKVDAPSSLLNIIDNMIEHII